MTPPTHRRGSAGASGTVPPEIPRFARDLQINQQTTPGDIEAFILSRLDRPAIVNGRVVYSFNNHAFVRDALTGATRNLAGDLYVIPFQLPGVWAYIESLLPDDLRGARHLVWSENDTSYREVPNWRHVTDADIRADMRATIEARYDETAPHLNAAEEEPAPQAVDPGRGYGGGYGGEEGEVEADGGSEAGDGGGNDYDE